MAYYRRTAIIGRRKADSAGRQPFKAFSLRGFWQPKTALAFARRSHLETAITIEHRVSDLSGLGRGGIDARWILVDGQMIPDPVSAEDDAAYAASDLEDVWSLEDGR